MTATTLSRPVEPVGGESGWRPGNFVLRNAWFAVAHSPDVTGRPVLRMVHSQPFRIRRAEDGTVHAAKADLGLADVQAASRSEPVPVSERFGHVWVWFGNGADADSDLIPDIPFLAFDKAQPEYARGFNYFHSTYELVMENILDLTHVDFVHGSFRGASHPAEEDEVRFESTTETVTMIRTTRGKPTSQYQREHLGVTAEFQDQTLFAHVFIRSGMCFLHSRYSAAPSIPLMQTNTPESRTLTRANYAFGIEQTTSDHYRRAWPQTASMIGDQDESVLRPQNPRYLDKAPRPDFSTRFDAAGLQYRERHNALVERQKAGDFGYASGDLNAPGLSQTLGVFRPS